MIRGYSSLSLNIMVQCVLHKNPSRVVIEVMELELVQVKDAIESVRFWDVKPSEVESLLHFPGPNKPAVAAAEGRPGIVEWGAGLQGEIVPPIVDELIVLWVRLVDVDKLVQGLNLRVVFAVPVEQDQNTQSISAQHE